MNKVTILAPDDWHCHLRDEVFLSRTVPDIATRFRKVLIMPNLKPPVTTLQQAQEYKKRILQYSKSYPKFMPLMTLYLQEEMKPAMIRQAKTSGEIIAYKLYPAGATTHSAAGIVDIEKIFPLLEVMEEVQMVLCVHGESIEANVDVFDRESRFIEKYLEPITKKFPKLKIVFEHISTKNAVDFVMSASPNVAATITVHHLLLNRNDLLVGGLHPHYYCLPILKKVSDQVALQEAATSGNSKFFLGTDSAPHSVNSKETCVCAAGIYTAHAAIELYAEIFESLNRLDRLENFASVFGSRFYNLPINEDKITLIKDAWTVPTFLSFGDQQVVPLRANSKISWKIQQSSA